MSDNNMLQINKLTLTSGNFLQNLQESEDHEKFVLESGNYTKHFRESGIQTVETCVSGGRSFDLMFRAGI